MATTADACGVSGASRRAGADRVRIVDADGQVTGLFVFGQQDDQIEWPVEDVQRARLVLFVVLGFEHEIRARDVVGHAAVLALDHVDDVVGRAVCSFDLNIYLFVICSEDRLDLQLDLEI